MDKRLKEKYDLIVSLGAACACSSILRKKNLQDYSYPFDWLINVELKDRIKLMNNQFDGWFDINDFEYVGQDLNDIYVNKKTGFLFIHDFNINTPIEESYPEVKCRYERRTKRLLEKIKEAENILFVYIATPDKKEHYDDEYLKECHQMLKNKYPEKNIKIKYIYQADEEYIRTFSDIEVITANYKYENSEKPANVADESKLIKFFISIKLKRKITLKRGLNFIFNIRRTKRSNNTKIYVTIFGIKIKFNK